MKQSLALVPACPPPRRRRHLSQQAVSGLQSLATMYYCILPLYVLHIVILYIVSTLTLLASNSEGKLELKVASFQKVPCVCQVSEINIPNHYPEL